MLLHGFPQDSSVLGRGGAACLHRAGLRTLAPDQRGYSPGARPANVVGLPGQRAAPPTSSPSWMPPASPAAHVVGHDWGGAVAWYLGSRDADRVETLTVLSTPHPAAHARGR